MSDPNLGLSDVHTPLSTGPPGQPLEPTASRRLSLGDANGQTLLIQNCTKPIIGSRDSLSSTKAPSCEQRGGVTSALAAPGLRCVAIMGSTKKQPKAELSIVQPQLLRIATCIHIFAESIQGPSTGAGTDSSKDQGIQWLANEITSYGGHPWNHAAASQGPRVIEQLIELYRLCMSVKDWSNNDISQKVMNCAFVIAFTETTSSPLALLGKLMLAVDRYPNELAVQLARDHDNITQWLENHYSSDMQRICNGFLKLYITHRQLPIQTAELVVANQMACEFARLLISSNGGVNIGLIKPLRQLFLNGNKPNLHYAASLERGLQTLEQDSVLRRSLHLINSPQDSTSIGAHIIRTTLQIPLRQPLTARDAKRTVLSALLAHFRQETTSGSCFAAAVAIEALITNPNGCLDDLNQILQRGNITRHFQNVTINSEFLLKSSQNSLKTALSLDHQGRVITELGTALPLGQIPGIQAVCLAMGLKDEEATYNNLLQRIGSGPVNVTVEELLDHLAKMSNIGPDAPSIAHMAFQAQRLNPLQKAWENAIASIGEGGYNGKGKEAVMASVLLALEPQLNFLSNVTKNRALKEVEKALGQRMVFLYDPSYPSCDPGQKGLSTDGAFVMYDRSERLNGRIDNSGAFLNFLSKIVTPILPADHAVPFLKHIQSDGFCSSVIKVYRSTLDVAVRTGGNQKPQKLIPWVLRGGTDAWEIRRLYLAKEHADPTHVLHCNNATELLKQMINLLAPTSSQKSPLLAVRIPNLHAFSMLPSHASVMEGAQQHSQVTEWIKMRLINPGKEVSDAHAAESLRSALTLFVKSELLSASAVRSFDALCGKIPKPLSIQAFRQQILKAILSADATAKKHQESIALTLDARLFELLTSQQQAKLSASAVHIADSNWGSDTSAHDLHFCIVMNPGSGELELWEAYDDGSRLAPMHQGTWVKGKSWEVLAE